MEGLFITCMLHCIVICEMSQTYIPGRRVKITVIIKAEHWHSCLVTVPIAPLLTGRRYTVCSVLRGGGGVGLVGEGDFGGSRLVIVTFLSLLFHVSHYLVEAGQLFLLVSCTQ